MIEEKVKISVHSGRNVIIVGGRQAGRKNTHPVDDVLYAYSLLKSKKSTTIYTNSADTLSVLKHVGNQLNVDVEFFLNGKSQGNEIEAIFEDLNKSFELIGKIQDEIEKGNVDDALNVAWKALKLDNRVSSVKFSNDDLQINKTPKEAYEQAYPKISNIPTSPIIVGSPIGSEHFHHLTKLADHPMVILSNNDKHFMDEFLGNNIGFSSRPIGVSSIWDGEPTKNIGNETIGNLRLDDVINKLAFTEPFENLDQSKDEPIAEKKPIKTFPKSKSEFHK